MEGMKIHGHPEMDLFPVSILNKYRSKIEGFHGQSLEKLNQRGGLSPHEIVTHIDGGGWFWAQKPESVYIERLAEIIREHAQ